MTTHIPQLTIEDQGKAVAPRAILAEASPTRPTEPFPAGTIGDHIEKLLRQGTKPDQIDIKVPAELLRS
jgi:hypothetical protein